MEIDATNEVQTLYIAYFGRPADPVGLDFWVGALERGTITVDNAVTFIANGAINNDRVVINGRVAVATAFTERVDTAQETLAYSGPAANLIAHDYVGGVRDLTTAALHMDPGQIDATIARIVGVPGVAEADVMMV